MLRAIIAVIVGYALWSVVWVVGNAVLFARAAEAVGRGEAFLEPGPLAGALVLSVACSLLAGAACGKIAGARTRPAALVLGGLLLLTGIGVQASIWNLEPLWYHAAFLVLLGPVTVLAAVIAAGRAGKSVVA